MDVWCYKEGEEPNVLKIGCMCLMRMAALTCSSIAMMK